MHSLFSTRSLFSDVKNLPGVYLLVDLDEQPLYVGKSKALRNRLEQHFVAQNSSATADGLLDVYDVLRVYIWYWNYTALDVAESAMQLQFQPRWNRALPTVSTGLPVLSLETASVVVGILDSPELVALRREPLERAENKLLHLLRAVRKARISGASPDTRQALLKHAEEITLILTK
jgi:excinuclease UvrABC nuclease subunit